MCSMCHYCGADMTESMVENKKQDNETSLKLNSKVPTRPCKPCGEKLKRENVKLHSTSPYETPLINPTSPLSGTYSCVPTCIQFSIDVKSSDRIRVTREESTIDGVIQSQNPILINNHNEGYAVRDMGSAQGHNYKQVKVDGSKSPTASSGEKTENSLPDDLDLLTWEPPEPENPQDNLDVNVACNDDNEDESIGSANWGVPNTFSSKDEVSGSYRLKEEKQRTMDEVVNGKFKTLVGQLLKSVDVSPSDKGGKSWVDIVTSLSWEAASFLKPDAIGGNAMNPDGYVKVKCIAAGSCCESKLIKGLVFKKHAAHKHMTTKYKNPRLLLISGTLGSVSGLSSFKSMDQEKDYLKSEMELIEMCRPNVLLVEKTVSRNIQESILAKGMTLVLDMKLHRLERVARCTGSPILSSDNLNDQNLKHSDSVHFEKLVEEYTCAGEGGKRPIKTLMFIEGCPTRLGCTILLKGTHTEELKRIKCIVRCAVVMAYHLILETSFLMDQRAMFSTIPAVNVADILPNNQQACNSASVDSSIQSVEYSSENRSVSTDIPICYGFNEKSANSLNLESTEADENSRTEAKNYSNEEKVLNGGNESKDDRSIGSDDDRNQIQSKGDRSNGSNDDRSQIQSKGDRSNQSKGDRSNGSDDDRNQVQSKGDRSNGSDDDRNQIQSKDVINAVLDSQSILVLMSRQNALRGTVCQQSHFSRIMFYKNFDVPLGKFLQDNLLNQTRLCETCQELPVAHIYYYAHCNKQLIIQVKQLPQAKCLPGEAERKLWMWGRCGRCKLGSTKRVLISTTACSLSYGKFLEHSLSRYTSSRKSRCGHSLESDFLYFFGLDHMVAMFRYSSVTTYTVSKPPQQLGFSGAIKQECLWEEKTKKVYEKGMLLFTEVADYLKKMRVQFDGSTFNLGGSIIEFCEVEKMVKQEREEFEEKIKNAGVRVGDPDRSAFKRLRLNRLMWDLLIESCLWDRRLNSLLSADRLRIESGVAEEVTQENSYSKMEGTSGIKVRSMGNFMEDDTVNGTANVKVMSGTSLEVIELPTKEIPVKGPLPYCNEQNDPSNTSNVPRTGEMPDQKLKLNLDVFTQCPSADGNILQKGSVILSHLQVHDNFPASMGIQNSHSVTDSKVLNKSASLLSPGSNLQESNEWFWKPFADIQQMGIDDLQKNYLPKFEFVCCSTRKHLDTAHQLITEEGRRLHIPLGTENYVLSDHEDELSSIIACALASSEDSSAATDVDRMESRIASGSTESSNGLTHDATLTSAHASSEESRASRAPENRNIELAVGYAKSLGRPKYSVICYYFNLFCELRNWCCLSEVDYIASLSRCRNWDAKGGKSKSSFAKTLDDRFVIKEIQRTELESFLGFASMYFKYMKESFESGSQTCLAKVLGIYQVTGKHPKSGKEVKHDVMVMENLTYNRNITRQYDLKGLLYARYNSATAGAGDVLLDQNFVNDMNSDPSYVSIKAKCHLQRAVWNDTTFLTSINVMDYSLLVGVDLEKRELVCGIIDYLRQYTWDKQLETWVKSSLVVPKNVLPTVISPIEYKKRFRKFMSTHFLCVPDHWCSKKSPDPCKLSGSYGDDSSQQKL